MLKGCACAGTDPSVFVFQRLDSVAEAPACCTCVWELEEGSLALGVAPGTDLPLDFATCMPLSFELSAQLSLGAQLGKCCGAKVKAEGVEAVQGWAALTLGCCFPDLCGAAGATRLLPAIASPVPALFTQSLQCLFPQRQS